MAAVGVSVVAKPVTLRTGVVVGDQEYVAERNTRASARKAVSVHSTSDVYGPRGREWLLAADVMAMACSVKGAVGGERQSAPHSTGLGVSSMME